MQFCKHLKYIDLHKEAFMSFKNQTIMTCFSKKDSILALHFWTGFSRVPQTMAKSNQRLTEGYKLSCLCDLDILALIPVSII